MSIDSGLALLACTAADRRNLVRAVNEFVKIDAWEYLKQAFDIACRNGDLRAVCEIERIGRENNRPELLLDDFETWVTTHGIKWFDLYQDDERQVRYIREEDVAFIESMIAERFSDRDVFWKRVFVTLDVDPKFPSERRALLECLAKHENPVISFVLEDPAEIERYFLEFCRESGMTVFRRYQEANESLGQNSFVYLVLDRDGLMKVFKQLPSRDRNALVITRPSEPDVYAALPVTDALPHCYGVVEVAEGIRFMKTSVVFGQVLSDFAKTSSMLKSEEVRHIVQRIAETLSMLHSHGIAYLDLRPENVKVNGSDVSLLDLGDSRFIDSNTGTVDTYLSDARYASPEVVLACRASTASDVFQLGILFHVLLTGLHPFIEQGEEPRYREEEILLFAMPNALKLYEPIQEFPYGSLIEHMLDKDPSKRPSAAEVAEALNGSDVDIRHCSRTGGRPRENNTVLFPARMGIPHKGHIEYMARLLELGYHLRISLQCSYVISDIDPIPKWVVMKMVAQALMEKGFGPEDFDFLFTPLPSSDEVHRLWFAMSDVWEDVVAIASANAGVHDLFTFSNKPMIDQRMLFGFEGEVYEDQSWGKILRRAVRTGDRETFDDYIARGSERIATFEELQRMYAATPILAQSGRITAVLLDEDDEEIVRTKVFRSLGPEASILRALEMQGKHIRIIDSYARVSSVEMDHSRTFIRYERMEVEGENQSIFFKKEE